MVTQRGSSPIGPQELQDLGHHVGIKPLPPLLWVALQISPLLLGLDCDAEQPTAKLGDDQPHQVRRIRQGSFSRGPSTSRTRFCRLYFPSMEIAMWILGRCLQNIKERLEIVCKTNFLYLMCVFILGYWERILSSSRKKKISAVKIGTTNFNDIFLDYRVIYGHWRKFIKERKVCRKIQINTFRHPEITTAHILYISFLFWLYPK